MKMPVAVWKELQGLAFYNGSLGAAAGVRATLYLDEEERHEC
jgi:hypothetical protein